MGRIVKRPRLLEERYPIPVPELSAAPLAAPAFAAAAVSGAVDDYGFAVATDPQPSGTWSFDAGWDDAPAPAAPLPEPARYDDAEAEARGREILERAALDAEALLADARDRARGLVEDAAARAEAETERARAAGRAEGLAAGRADAERETAETLASARSLVEMAHVEREKLIRSAEPEIVRLSLGIAERILHQQVAIDRDVVVEMARAALSRLVERDAVTVRVNPADLERVREQRDDLGEGDRPALRIVEDHRVDRGGVVVESESGAIDARIRTQLVEARRVLHLDDEIVVEPAPEATRDLCLSAI